MEVSFGWIAAMLVMTLGAADIDNLEELPLASDQFAPKSRWSSPYLFGGRILTATAKGSECTTLSFSS